MLTVVFGPSRSGKSVFAEKLLSNVTGPKCYVATLPPLRVYQARIREHQRRRPQDWTLIELVGELDYDATRLQGVRRMFRGVLFDGLSVYLARALPEPIANPMFRAQSIMRWLTNNVIAEYGCSVLVDCHPISLEISDLSRTIAVVHSILRQSADRVYFVNQGTAELQAK